VFFRKKWRAGGLLENWKKGKMEDWKNGMMGNWGSVISELVIGELAVRHMQ
jgi:hypothetical protein